jgi:glycosyltransferase involved in cell wall biosynthesis
MEPTEEPKVSVIVPCYNGEKYVAEAIDSVLSQTYHNFEILAVNDGSTDGTRNILHRYKDSIRILEHENRVNRGQAASLNLALRESNGEYIAILNQDDLWQPEKIQKQVAFLEDHPDIGLVYANGLIIDENGNTLYKIYGSKPMEDGRPEDVLMRCYFLIPTNSLVRASVLKSVGDFDKRLRAALDHDMAIRISEITKLGYISDVLFYFRKHHQSLTRTRTKLLWREGFTILMTASKRYNYSFTALRKRFAVLNFRLGQCELAERRYTHALLRFLIACLSDPLRGIKVALGLETITPPN